MNKSRIALTDNKLVEEVSSYTDLGKGCALIGGSTEGGLMVSVKSRDGISSYRYVTLADVGVEWLRETMSPCPGTWCRVTCVCECLCEDSQLQSDACVSVCGETISCLAA